MFELNDNADFDALRDAADSALFDRPDADDRAFDALLRTTLARRPEPRIGTDFAARVLAVVPPRRVASVWPVVLAAVAMAAVLLLGVLRVTAIEASLAALTSTTSASVTASTTDALSLLPAGGIGLLIALVWLTARSAFDRGDAGVRF